MNYVFDIDGTLCFDGVSIDPEIKNEINKLSENNEVIFASARPIRDLFPILKGLKFNKLIGGNGSIIVENDEMKVVKEIDNEAFKNIQKLIEEYNLEYILDDEFNYASNCNENHEIYKQLDPDELAQKIEIKEVKKPIKAILLNIKKDLKTKLLNNIKSNLANAEVLLHGDEGSLDITAAGINKYTTLKNELGVSQYVAFGNDVNDIDLLNNAAWGYFVEGKDLKMEQLSEKVSKIDKEELLAILKTINNKSRV